MSVLEYLQSLKLIKREEDKEDDSITDNQQDTCNR